MLEAFKEEAIGNKAQAGLGSAAESIATSRRD